MAYDKGMRVLAASQAADVAQEHAAIRHGLLSFALVTDGLQQWRGDFEPADGRIVLDEWLRYGAARVPELSIDLKTGVVGAARSFNADQPLETLRTAQQPSIFDFGKQHSRVVLQRR
jgi:hypothetical protein